MAIIIKSKTGNSLKKTNKSQLTVDGIKTESKLSAPSDGVAKPAQKGFIKSTIAELRLVSWPSLQQTFKWGVVVILFTVLISMILGFTDHIFSASIKFIDCTSPQGRGSSTTWDECARDLANQLTFRN